MKTIKFYTVGCKVNQYETQAIKEQLAKLGFSEIDNGRPADIYLINTCTVTHKADRDSRHFINFAHRQNTKAKIVVTGCYTELDSDEIVRLPGVTHIVKNKDKAKIADLLNDTNACRLPADRQGKTKTKHNATGISNFSGHTRAFLKIQDGCNHFCSFCKVPLVRGKSRSRPISEIIREAKRLKESGFREIVLCGICLGAYGKDLPSLPSLVDVIKRLEALDGLLRIRLSSIEAGDITDNLIQAMAESKKICRHLHIPIQSGDDEILKKMNRKFTYKKYLLLVNKLKKAIPDIAVTCDIMVNFPSETEENFKNTVKLLTKITPLKVHIFSYSQRKGTLASGFADKTDPKIARKRVLELKGIAGICSDKYRKKFLKKNTQVLVENQDKIQGKYWWGYTDNYLKVRLESKRNLKNMLIPVTLKKLSGDFLEADIC